MATIPTLSAPSSSNRTSSTAPPRFIPLRASSNYISVVTILSASLIIFLLSGLGTPRAAAIAEELIMNNSAQQQPQQYRSHGLDDGEPKGVAKFVLQEAHISDAEGEPSSSIWRTLTYREVTSLWQSSESFAEMFAASLAAVPHSAIFWESTPVTRETMDKPYEYVTVSSSSLARVSPDGSPFAEYLSPGKGTTDVVTFRNMRRDARLVSPCRAGDYGYAHLAAFVRSAPKQQVVNFFRAVGAALEEEVASRGDDRPVWLSTSGLGVYWLHARLDSVPKYYTYQPYKAI